MHPTTGPKTKEGGNFRPGFTQSLFLTHLRTKLAHYCIPENLGMKRQHPSPILMNKKHYFLEAKNWHLFFILDSLLLNCVGLQNDHGQCNITKGNIQSVSKSQSESNTFGHRGLRVEGRGGCHLTGNNHQWICSRSKVQKSTSMFGN